MKESKPPPRRTQIERTESTRAALIASGRVLFTNRGFSDVGTAELAAHAGVSRGAMYHQFGDKQALFAAVLETVEAELTDRIVATVASATATLEALQLAAGAFLDASHEPEVRRILVLDGPAILGWEQYRDVMRRYGLGLTEALLAAGVDDGSLQQMDASAAAATLLGALNEAAMFIAQAKDPKVARREIQIVIDAIIGALAA